MTNAKDQILIAPRSTCTTWHVDRRTFLRGWGPHRLADAGRHAAVGGLAAIERRSPRGGWRSSSSPTACTCPIGRRRRKAPISISRRHLKVLAAVQGPDYWSLRADARQGPAPMATVPAITLVRRRQLPDRLPGPQDGRCGYQARRLRRSGGGAENRQGDAVPVAGAGHRAGPVVRQLRLRL